MNYLLLKRVQCESRLVVLCNLISLCACVCLRVQSCVCEPICVEVSAVCVDLDDAVMCGRWILGSVMSKEIDVSTKLERELSLK